MIVKDLVSGVKDPERVCFLQFPAMPDKMPAPGISGEVVEFRQAVSSLSVAIGKNSMIPTRICGYVMPE